MSKKPTLLSERSLNRELNASSDVLKFLEKLQKSQPKHAKQIVRKWLLLSEEAMPQDAKALHGYDGVYRVDSGEYRIIYRFDVSTIYILALGHRNDGKVYKDFSRKRNS